MSKKSTKSNLDFLIRKFLADICSTNEWMPWELYNDHICVTGTGNHLLLQFKTRGGMKVLLRLRKHNKQDVWLVTEFDVQGENVLHGDDVMNHLYKRYACAGDNFDDFKSANLGDLWTITSPRNVESLFREHDSLSRVFKLTPIFDL